MEPPTLERCPGAFWALCLPAVLGASRSAVGQVALRGRDESLACRDVWCQHVDWTAPGTVVLMVVSLLGSVPVILLLQKAVLNRFGCNLQLVTPKGKIDPPMSCHQLPNTNSFLLLVTSATLVGTSALLVVTMFAINLHTHKARVGRFFCPIEDLAFAFWNWTMISLWKGPWYAQLVVQGDDPRRRLVEEVKGKSNA